jgi:hypothetical protein
MKNKSMDRHRIFFLSSSQLAKGKAASSETCSYQGSGKMTTTTTHAQAFW